MSRLKLLDCYGGEGGSWKGWTDAGFDVEGVDNSKARLRRYPGRSHLADAIEYVLEHGHRFDVISGSPTCTGYSAGTRALPDRLTRYDRQIAAFREACEIVGKPYVIENVEGARDELRSPILLCGRQFNLTATDTDGTELILDRHRLFESNLFLMGLPHEPHSDRLQVAGSYGGARRDKDEARNVRKGGYVPQSADVQRALLGVPWMSEKGCRLSIPPVYTKFLGEQIIEQLAVAA